MRLLEHDIAGVIRRAVSERHIDGESTAAIFYNLSEIERRLAELRDCFPDTALHAVAVKAGPLSALLEHTVQHGMGLEAASWPEIMLALNAGARPDQIVFDSPAKTRLELTNAIRKGLHINADSIYELDRIAEILASGVESGDATFGVRVNPQVGVGSIASTSVAGSYSKFGVPLLEFRAAVVERFIRYPWLGGLHIHIGSQGCPVEMLLAGVGRVLELADEIDAATSSYGRAVRILDIGGGLPVSYSDTQPAVSMSEYAARLRDEFPVLFGPRFRLITEFGRWVFANAGWAVSRVEYVKHERERRTAIVHLGADMFLRKCYRPKDWHHDVFVCGPDGIIKSEPDELPCTIAGPLCFAGDLLAKDIDLPPISPGDLLVVRDTGAYTVSMWSRYNSRQMPNVLGYHDDGRDLRVIKRRETPDQLIEFWT